jgi:hypothetical protein
MIQKRKLEGLMFERAAEFYKDENNHLRVRYIKDENGNWLENGGWHKWQKDQGSKK